MTTQTGDLRSLATRIDSAADEVTDGVREILSGVLGATFPEARSGDLRSLATRIDSAADEVTDGVREILSGVLGATFPEARSGDESPDMVFAFDQAISKAVREYIEAWTSYNVAPTLTWRNDDGDDVICSCGNEPHMDGFYACDAFGVVFEDGGIPAGYKGATLYKCARCEAVYHEPSGLRAGAVLIGERLS